MTMKKLFHTKDTLHFSPPPNTPNEQCATCQHAIWKQITHQYNIITNCTISFHCPVTNSYQEPAFTNKPVIENCHHYIEGDYYILNLPEHPGLSQQQEAAKNLQ